MRILTCIQGGYRFRNYFAAAARKISINGGRGEGGEGGGGIGSYIQDLKVSTEVAVTGSGRRLFHSLMVRGKKDSFL